MTRRSSGASHRSEVTRQAHGAVIMDNGVELVGPERRSPQPSRSLTIWTPFLVTLALGLWGIRRDDSLWGDETATSDAAHRSLSGLFGLLRHTDSVHGLYYLFMHGVFAVFGDSPVTLRLPSVLAMSAAAAGVAAIGRRMIGPRAGLLAGLAFPLAPAVLHYMQEGRSYAMVTALVTWSTWLLIRSVEEQRARWWIWYVVATLVGCLLNEFAVLALAAHGTTLLLARVPWRVGRAWLTSMSAVVVGLAPLIAVTLPQKSQISWLVAPGWPNLYDYPALVVLGVAGSAVVAGRRGSGDPGRPVRLWALALPLLLVPTAILMVVTFVVEPLYVNRYVLYFVIGYALPVGAAVDRLWSLAGRSVRAWLWRSIAVLLIGLLVAAQVPDWLAQRSPGSRQDDDAAAARAVQDVARPGDGLLFLPIRRREVTQVFPDAFHGLRDVALARSPTASNTLFGVELPADRIRAALLATRRVVLVSDDPLRGEPQDFVPQETVKQDVIRKFFRQCAVRHVTGVLVTVYVRDGSC